jgi:AmmeMemoRadiSam system protein B
MKLGGMPRTIIFIGPNHTGYGSDVAVSRSDWKTPMATMRCDNDLADSIGLPSDERSHSREHSIEVQMPFVQYLDPSVRHVSISMLDQDLDTALRVGEAIARSIKVRDDITVVASSDFTHCGLNYGVPVPKGMNAGQYAGSIDKEILHRLTELDLEGAYRTRDMLGITACGLGPICAMIASVRSLGPIKAHMIRYSTSYDISPSSSAVGYASMVFH